MKNFNYNVLVLILTGTAALALAIGIGRFTYTPILPFMLEELNITKKLNDKSNFSIWNYDSLNESKRIASIVKERIIKEKYEFK